MDKRVVLGMSIGTGVGAVIAVRRFTWGMERDEAERPLPGDDVVAEGQTLITRGLTIDASPTRSGHGSSKWATGAAAGTAMTSSTRRVGVPRPSFDEPRPTGSE
jgi:hypothetical protein